MAIYGPTNFTSNKQSALPGEEITLSWTAATGDFNRYRLYGFYEGAGDKDGWFESLYLSAAATSAKVTFPNYAVPGSGFARYILEAQKGIGEGDEIEGEIGKITLDISCKSAITAPSNFSCGKNAVYPGETITCTWTAATGDFDEYDIVVAYNNAFRHYYPSKTVTSYNITIPTDDLAPVGLDPAFTLSAIKGDRDHPADSAGGGSFTVYVVSAPPSKPASITVSDVTQGMPVVITWEAATSGAGTVNGYTLQRSVNSGEFETIYTGTGLTFPDHGAGPDWFAVQYRVQANGNGGNSDWTTSEMKDVLGGISLPHGGRLEQLENRDAEPVFPVTTTDGVFRKSDGRNLEQILAGMELGVTGPPGRDGKDGKDGAVGPAGPPGSGGLVEMETSIPVASRTANTLYGLILEKHG